MIDQLTSSLHTKCFFPKFPDYCKGVFTLKATLKRAALTLKRHLLGTDAGGQSHDFLSASGWLLLIAFIGLGQLVLGMRSDWLGLG